MLKLAVFDVDGTLAPPPSIWERIYYEIGNWETVGLPYLESYLRGDISFDKFARLDAKSYKGNPQDIIYRAAKKMEFIANLGPFMSHLKANNVKTAIISCTIYQFAKLLQDRWGINYCYANPLKVNGSGALNGDIDMMVPERGKGKILKFLQGKIHVRPEETLVIGDSLIDMDMFKRAAYRISFLSSPEKLQKESTFILPEHDLLPLLDYLNQVNR